MFKCKLLGCVLVLMLMLGACAKTQDGRNTQVQAGALGGILGAVIGGVTGSSAMGALIGGSVGTATGVAVGTAIASSKEEYAAKEDFYDDQIGRASEYNAELSKVNENLRQRNDARAIEITRLENGYRDGTVQVAELKQEHSRIQEELRATSKALGDARSELSTQETALANAHDSADIASDKLEELAKNTQAMRAYIAELEGQIGVLAAQDASLGRYL